VGKFSHKSADSAAEKSKKCKQFLSLLQQELSSKPLARKTIFFARNAHTRPIMAALIFVQQQLKESLIYEL